MPINVNRVLERYDQAKSVKMRSNSLREEAGRYSWPNAQDMVRTSETKTEGELRTTHLYDSTALQAAYKMTSGIFSYLMPVGVKWFEFLAQDVELNNDPTMREWMSVATSLTHKEIWRSNFQRHMFITIRSMIVFGTGVISTEQSDGKLVFASHHVGHMFFDDNSKGEIDTVYRQIFYTARQAVQEFGKDNLGKSITKAIASGKLDERFEFVHVTAPNQDFDPTKLGSKSKRVKSVYINIPDRHLVKEGGFDQLPYLVARFSLAPGEIMGRGPAIEGLPEIKMLDRMKKTFIESSEKAVNPPLMVEDDGVVGQPVTEPNGMIYIRPGAQFPQPLNTGTNVQLNAEIIREQQLVVKEIFFNNMLQSLSGHKNMTATEAEIRKEDDLVMISPAITSLQNEIFDPLISRVLALLIKSGRVPPPPQAFDFDVVYQGRLALAMSNVQSNAMETTLAKWQPYVQLFPNNPFDNVDTDVAFRTSWLNAGGPAEGLTDFDEMIEGREQIKQAQMAQAQAEVAETGSKAYKNVATAPEEGSLAAGL